MTNWSLVSQEFAARRQAEGTQAYMQGVDRLSRGIDTAYGAFRDQQQIALSAQAQAFDQQLALRRQEMQDEENKAQIALLEQRKAEGAANLQMAQALLQAGINEEMALTQKATLRAQRLQAEKMASDIESGAEDRNEMIDRLIRMSQTAGRRVKLTIDKGANGGLLVREMTDQEWKDEQARMDRQDRTSARNYERETAISKGMDNGLTYAEAVRQDQDAIGGGPAAPQPLPATQQQPSPPPPEGNFQWDGFDWEVTKKAFESGQISFNWETEPYTWGRDQMAVAFSNYLSTAERSDVGMWVKAAGPGLLGRQAVETARRRIPGWTPMAHIKRVVDLIRKER